ncbi:uncharacterized protein A1O5_11317, partial [Cladophialophora psammophila CBS 110553]
IRKDEEHHRIVIGKFPDTIQQVRKPAGLADIAFTFHSLQDVAVSHRQRKALDISPSGARIMVRRPVTMITNQMATNRRRR